MDVAGLSKFVVDLAEETEGSVEIPLSQVKGTILKKVVDFCHHHEKVESS